MRCCPQTAHHTINHRALCGALRGESGITELDLATRQWLLNDTPHKHTAYNRQTREEDGYCILKIDFAKKTGVRAKPSFNRNVVVLVLPVRKPCYKIRPGFPSRLCSVMKYLVYEVLCQATSARF